MSEKKNVIKKRRIKASRILILLFLIAVAAFIFYRLSLRNKFHAGINAVRDAGYPVTGEELDKWYTIPADAENAANIILDAFSYYKEPNDSNLLLLAGNGELFSRNAPLSEQNAKNISLFLSDNQKTLELLHESSKYEHSRYPVDLSLGMEINLDHFSKLRRCAQFLQVEAIYSAQQNEPNSAKTAIKSILGVSRSLSKEPVTVSQLVCFAIHGLAVASLEHVINKTDFSDAQLAELGRMFSQAQGYSDLSRAFTGDRCQMLNYLKNPGVLSNDYVEGIPPRLILEVYKALGFADHEGIIYLDLGKEIMEAFKLPLHQRQKDLNAIEVKANNLSKMNFIIHKFMTSFDRINIIESRNIAGLRTAQAAIAIQRYRLASGRLPDSISDLVPNYIEAVPLDPFDGRELRYQKIGSGFEVYSIDSDLKDEGGKEKPKSSKEQRGATWDITFIVEK